MSFQIFQKIQKFHEANGYAVSFSNVTNTTNVQDLRQNERFHFINITYNLISCISCFYFLVFNKRQYTDMLKKYVNSENQIRNRY